MSEYFTTAITGILTALGAWYAARRKNLAETRITEIDAVERAVKVWRELSEDLQKRYEGLMERMEKMETELAGLRQDNKRLIAENRELIKELKK